MILVLNKTDVGNEEIDRQQLKKSYPLIQAFVNISAFGAFEPSLDFPAQMERMRQLRARFQRAKVGSIERANYTLRRERLRRLGQV